MQSQKVILTAGGDARMCYAAARLAEKTGWLVQAAGFSRGPEMPPGVTLCGDGLEDAKPFDVLVLPIGAGTDGAVQAPLGTVPLPLTRLTALAKPGALAAVGQLAPTGVTLLERAGVEIVDYLKREELCIRNAVPTAEGAIQIAMAETRRTLHGANALITGGGRIARALIPRLKGLGMEVCVCARSCADRAAAASAGCQVCPMKQLKQAAAECHVLFNTVPAKVVDAGVLQALPQDAVVIDLASRPGGTDFAAAEQLERRVVWALALPGKVAPITAGGIIADTICNILEER